MREGEERKEEGNEERGEGIFCLPRGEEYGILKTLFNIVSIMLWLDSSVF